MGLFKTREEFIEDLEGIHTHKAMLAYQLFHAAAVTRYFSLWNAKIKQIVQVPREERIQEGQGFFENYIGGVGEGIGNVTEGITDATTDKLFPSFWETIDGKTKAILVVGGLAIVAYYTLPTIAAGKTIVKDVKN